MKIGIISMQRVENYGSFLQAYGLKKMIESLGHEVVFMDYRNGEPVAPHSRKEWIKHVLYRRTSPYIYFKYFYLYHFKHKCRFIYLYDVKYLPMLGVSYHRNSRKKVDIAVIGSDEVFNCLQRSLRVGFSEMLFGQHIRAKKVISYAGCFGFATLEGLAQYGLTERLSGYLQSFAAISVRDQNSLGIVQALAKERNPIVSLDPVLMYDFELPDLKLEGDGYIVLYTSPRREYAQEEVDMIRSFCARNGKRLVTVGRGQTWVDEMIDADPFQALAYFRAADFIIADTFHGAVFSIKYNKNFAVRVRPDNRNKLGDLISRLKMESQLIDDYTTLQSLYERTPDFREANRIIAEEKEKAMRYLEENLRL